jgi:dTDP-4-dehydrorhamnose 3,5-epimerase
MQIIPTQLKDVLIVEPQVFIDRRGYFMEIFQERRYTKAGIDRQFVQDNFSYSRERTLRGLHYQVLRPQAKLVQVFSGEIFDVAVDLRRTSPTFGKWVGVTLSGENKRQLFIPEGFAHGFCVLSPSAVFTYKCSDYYDPQDEGGLRWSDPQINIRWPLKTPILSSRDRFLPLLKELSPDLLPQVKGRR